MLNIPTLKAHKHAGATMLAKNHFGSHTRNDAKHLHGGLVAPEQDNPRRQGYGLFRVQVDLMGHELLGSKNSIYLMDALWSSDYEIGEPVKWTMAPFNNDWMSSILLSLDPVAIESVGFDFLRAEFTIGRGLATYPQMEGVDDYLHQAADSTTWPDNFDYDPENDRTSLQSLGVHGHWNNAIDKQYSRNLGTGNGIELIKINPFIIQEGEPSLVFSVERSTGDIFAQGCFIGSGADLAERIDVSEPVEPGDVGELDPTRPGHYRKARGQSHLIAGVITTEPGFVLGNTPLNPPSRGESKGGVLGRPMLALMGRVPVKTTTESGPIHPGDLLTVSSKPGYAMRCAEAKECEGAIIGKALEPLEREEGLILVLVVAH